MTINGPLAGRLDHLGLEVREELGKVTLDMLDEDRLYCGDWQAKVLEVQKMTHPLTFGGLELVRMVPFSHEMQGF